MFSEIKKETLYGWVAVQRLWPSGALRLVDLKDPHCRSRVFYGYTVKEALQDFRNDR